jgi:hypothetical protein
MLRLALPVVVIALAGCQTTAANRDGPVLMRTDGRSVGSSAALTAQFKQDATICKGEADKASLSAPPVYYSLSLANNLAADQALHNQRQKVVSVYVGCMAARGYIKAPEGTKPAVTF